MLPKTIFALVLACISNSLIAHAQSVPPPLAPAAEAERALTLPTFEVRSEKDEGYLSTQTTSGSRTVEMLRDVPATISVMNRQLMEDLNITTVDGSTRGETFDYSLRWALLDGKLESNWTYFTTRSLNGGANPSVPNPVRLELAAIFDINQSGNDKQGTESNGIEIETIANLTSNWRLMGNFSSTELSTINRYPQLNGFQAEAKAKGIPTPETDAFLPTVPEGTPGPRLHQVHVESRHQLSLPRRPAARRERGRGFPVSG